MEHYEETKEIKEVINKKLVGVTCDVCKRRFKNNNWDGSYWDRIDTKIRLEEGTHYPECASSTVTTLDICPDCIRDVFNYLRFKGADIREDDVSY